MNILYEYLNFDIWDILNIKNTRVIPKAKNQRKIRKLRRQTNNFKR